MLSLAGETLDEVLCVNACYPNPAERFADMDRVRDEVLASLPNVRYLEATPPGEWEMYERAGGFFVESATDREREAVRWWRRLFEAEMRRAQEEIGAIGAMLGIRAEESWARAMRIATYGEAHTRKDGLSVVLPFGAKDIKSRWSAKDVWAYVISRKLPWGRIYDVAPEGRERARSGFVFATGGADAIRRHGAWETWKLAYPEEFYRWVERFPEIGALA